MKNNHANNKSVISVKIRPIRVNPRSILFQSVLLCYIHGWLLKADR